MEVGNTYKGLQNISGKRKNEKTRRTQNGSEEDTRHMAGNTHISHSYP